VKFAIRLPVDAPENLKGFDVGIKVDQEVVAKSFSFVFVETEASIRSSLARSSI
jgi:hypothetical protein